MDEAEPLYGRLRHRKREGRHFVGIGEKLHDTERQTLQEAVVAFVVSFRGYARIVPDNIKKRGGHCPPLML